MDDVLSSVLRQKELEIEYRKFDADETTTRIVQPLSVLTYDAHLYLAARTTETPEPEVRTFRFSRIVSTSPGGGSFEYPSHTEYDPGRLFRDSIGIWAGAGEPKIVRVRLAPKWQTYVKHHSWHHSQEVEGVGEDGRIQLKMFLRCCPELERWVLGFGEECEVVEPTDLREKIAERVRAACQSLAVSGTTLADGQEA